MSQVSSLSDLSSVEDDCQDFEFVENEIKQKLTVEAQFIKQYKEYMKQIESFRYQQQLTSSLQVQTARFIHQYLHDRMPQLLTQLNLECENDEADWVITSQPTNTASILRQNLRFLQQAKDIFSGKNAKVDVMDAKIDVSSELRKWIQELSGIAKMMSLNEGEEETGEEREEVEQLPNVPKDSYSVEQQMFDYKIVRKSLPVVRNVLQTTSAEKFTQLHALTDSKKIRSNLFGLLDHLKRWFEHLLQRYLWFLEMKHEKFPFCVKSEKLTRIFKEIPSIELEFHWLLDEYLSNFKLAFSYCQRFGHIDIMYFFYEALVQSCLSKPLFYEQVQWPRLPANLQHLKDRFTLMEHQACVLEKMIFSNPLRLVEETTNAEEAYCGYVWLKYDACLQHFHSMFDARQQGLKWSDELVHQEKQWLDWMHSSELSLEQMPQIPDVTCQKLTPEHFLLTNEQEKSKKLEQLIQQLDVLQSTGKEYEMLIDELSID